MSTPLKDALEKASEAAEIRAAALALRADAAEATQGIIEYLEELPVAEQSAFVVMRALAEENVRLEKELESVRERAPPRPNPITFESTASVAARAVRMENLEKAVQAVNADVLLDARDLSPSAHAALRSARNILCARLDTMTAYQAECIRSQVSRSIDSERKRAGGPMPDEEAHTMKRCRVTLSNAKDEIARLLADDEDPGLEEYLSTIRPPVGTQRALV